MRKDKKPRRKLSCLGCLGTVGLLLVAFVFLRALPSTPAIAPIPTVAPAQSVVVIEPTPTVALPAPTPAVLLEWAHWHAASPSLRFDNAAVWTSKAYPDLSNADLVRLAHEVVACVDAAGEAQPLIDMAAVCLLTLKPN